MALTLLDQHLHKLPALVLSCWHSCECYKVTHTYRVIIDCMVSHCPTPYLLLVFCEHRHKAHTANKTIVYSMLVRKKVAIADMDTATEVDIVPSSTLLQFPIIIKLRAVIRQRHREPTYPRGNLGWHTYIYMQRDS